MLFFNILSTGANEGGCWYTLPLPLSHTSHVPARPYKTGLNSYQMVLLPLAHGNIFFQK